jgi:RND superfamily putative drug exporter
MLTRLANLAHAHPRRVIALAVALAVFAGAVAGGVADRLGPYGADDPDSETFRTGERLHEATGLMNYFNAVVLVRGDAPLTAARTRARVERVSSEIRGVDGVGRVANWYETRDPAMVSRDRRSTYVVATFKADAEEEDTADLIAESLAGEPGVTVGGGAAGSAAVNRIVGEDLARAEMLAFPLLFLLSFWFFRSLVSALLPPLVGGLAIVLTFLGLQLVNEATDLSVFALNLVTGLGLGLAIDWSLFVVSRYREEIAPWVSAARWWR